MSFTPAQSSAIAARGNVLVIAGAGTGKTRTLIERCLQRLREGASLDRMLLVTFTEAAAAEMRARLRKALQADLAAGLTQSASSQSSTLAEQLALLDSAQISTLHSFCLRLVREHFHRLAIDPQLVILDERQTRPLTRDCLTALLDEHYAGRHPHSAAVQKLIRRVNRGSDEHLRALVWQLHRYTQTLPDPDKWFADQLGAFREKSPTQWHAWLMAGFHEWRGEWLDVLASAPAVSALKLSEAALAAVPAGQRVPSGLQNQTPGQAKTESQKDTPDALSCYSIAAMALASVLAADSTQHWQRRKTELREPLGFDKLFEEAQFFLSLFGTDGSAAAMAEDWDWCRHEMAALVQLTQQFAARFGEAKRQLGGVDFSDLEQFALRLLRDDATGVARQCRMQFTHVYVDEYQDINAAQDAILCAVSGTGADANRFLVGDLKQSIYRFRLADPRIFAGYVKAWRGGDLQPPAQGATQSVIALSDNFRSREAILNFVNPLFRSLMRESIGGVAYDSEAELKFGNPEGRAELRSAAGVVERGVLPAPSDHPDAQSARCGQTRPTPRVQLHILTKAADETSEESDTASDLIDLLAIEREARCVARRLFELHASGHEVWSEEEKALRRVEWRDMVVLMRSPGSRVESYAQEFHRAGVPLHAARGGFYEALEVSDLLNLLRLLDNPLQDLPLLAVLRSPLVAMSLEELVGLRVASEKGILLWDALTRFCAAGEPATQSSAEALLPETSVAGTPGARSLFQKSSAFLTRFNAWRQLLRLSSLTQCLERVLAETHYESLLLVEPRGAERVANVRRLLDLARQFDPYQRQGLHRFLQFIAAQEEAELDHAPAPAPSDHAVRLMSIHQSKGLEFPVVVVAGLGTKLNERDLRGDILLDERFGLCPMVAPPGRERRYASLPHWLARRRGRRELLGEELRLLYVALTRARDTLLLVGTDTCKDVAEKWRGPETKLNDLSLLKARSPLDWLCRWLPTVTADKDWCSDASGKNELLSWCFYAADDKRLVATGVTLGGERTTQSEHTPLPYSSSLGGGTPAAASSTDFVSLRAKLEWQYPHASATHESAKTSVTVLRRRAVEAEPEASTPFAPRFTVAPRTRGGLTATQVGLAHHAFLQSVDLARTATMLDLRNEAARLTAAGALTEVEEAALDFSALLTFWESPVGQQVRENARRVQREVPFTARFTVGELAEMGLIRSQQSGVSSQKSDQFPLAGGEKPIDEPLSTPAPLLRGREREQYSVHLHAAPNPEPESIIVQGVADLVVFGAREIWLLDYKTDHIDVAELPAKVREHGPQLSLYAMALERIYCPKKVTRTWLHFLALGRTELL